MPTLPCETSLDEHGKGADGQAVRALQSFKPIASGGRQRGLGLLDDGAERAALVHRQVGHDLAVELDPGELGAVDELRVGQPFGAHRGVDPLDPQRAEAALLHLAVAVGVLARLLDRLASDADGVLAAAAIALGRVQNPLVLGVRGYAAFDTGHALVLLNRARRAPTSSPCGYPRRREQWCRGSGGCTWRCG